MNQERVRELEKLAAMGGSERKVSGECMPIATIFPLTIVIFVSVSKDAIPVTFLPGIPEPVEKGED